MHTIPREPSSAQVGVRLGPSDQPPALQVSRNIVSYVAPGDLTVDAKRFQYKGAIDEKGATGALHGVDRWDDRLANPVLAWQTNDGSSYVANGHQRTDCSARGSRRPARCAGALSDQMPPLPPRPQLMTDARARRAFFTIGAGQRSPLTVE
jgi:hypothetical protein